MYSSMDDLPKPPLWPGSGDEESVAESPSGHQDPIPPWSSPPILSSSSGNPGQCLPYKLWGHSPPRRPGQPWQYQFSGAPALPLYLCLDSQPLHPRTLPGVTHCHCLWGQTWATRHACHDNPVSPTLAGGTSLPLPPIPTQSSCTSLCSRIHSLHPPPPHTHSIQGGRKECRTLSSLYPLS